MLNENEAHMLKDLGLTLLQARVYLTLLSLANPTAGEAAKLSKIARQEVYRAINELLERGLVTKIVTAPTKFKPLPLSEGASMLLERRIKKTSELKLKVREIFKKDVVRESEHQHYEFKMIPEKAPWFKYRTQRFESYKTFDLLTTVERFSSRLIHDEEAYRRAAQREAKIRIITEKPSPESAIWATINALRKSPNFEFRHIPTPTRVILIISDNKDAALAISPTNRVGPPYLVSDHPSFIHMAQHYFDVTWEKAIKP